MLQRSEELDRGELLFDDVEGCRLWVGHGTEDRVTSFKATARFMERLKLKDKTFRIYKGHYHKCMCSLPYCRLRLINLAVHDEPGQDGVSFANDVADWILARSGVNSTEAGTPSEVTSKL